MNQPADILRSGLAEMGLSLAAPQTDRLLAYLAELAQWNRSYNLTAVRDARQMVSRHLLDSLTPLPWMAGDRFVDIGSGAGLPGVPLAVALPERRITLVDANGKKTRFLRHVVRTLKLDNLEVAQSRAEAFRPEKGYDAALARAVASPPVLLAAAEHLVAPGGCLLAMIGREEAPPPDTRRWRWRSTERLMVPAERGQRHLMIFERL